MLREDQTPRFDLAYIDGGHTWDVTGYAFVLCDLLLRPGGWIIFDDMEWTIDRSPAINTSEAKMARYSADERAAKGVRMVWDLVMPSRGYTDLEDNKALKWGVARKPR
jgi:predicted O-methyltransferase YrrM